MRIAIDQRHRASCLTDSLMDDMVHGDGYYVRTTQASRINAILTQIIRELPLAIVE